MGMWYDVLPAFGIVVCLLNLPQVTMYFTNKLLLGNTYTRKLDNYDHYLHFLRDTRISGNDNPYNQKNELDCWEPESAKAEVKCECP